MVFSINPISLEAQETIEVNARLLTPEEFYLSLNAAEVPLIIDVRTWKEYRKDRIPGAKLTESSVMLKTIVDSFDLEQAIFIYCDDNQRSTAACSFLKDWGYKNVNELAGGMIAWKLASYDLDIEKISKSSQ